MAERRDTREDRLAQACLLLTMIVLAAVTWRKWGYLPIDSGREMYVPAAIMQGKRLYFDLWYPYGPLIPYWHAALFRFFGIHLDVLIGSGLFVVALAAALLYRVGRLFLPVAWSFAAVFAFLLQAFQVDLFNYILPYSYAAAYGSMLAILLLWLLLREHYWASGCVAGLMALAKLEFGAAAYAGLAAALALRGFDRKTIGAFLPGAVVCGAVYGWYLHALGAEFFLGQNLSILPGSHFQQHFAALWNLKTGLDLSPSAVALSMARGFGGFAALAACLVLAARSQLARWLLPSLALALCLMPENREAVKILRPLFFNSGMIWIGLVVMVMACQRKRHARAIILLSVVAMACGTRSLVKMTPNGYAMFFDVLVYLVWLVALSQVAGRFSISLDGRFGGVAALVFCASLIALTLHYYPVRSRTFPVSSDRGTLYTAPEIGEGFSQAIAFIESAQKQSRSVVILPEDTALYFFSGTLAPSRWYLTLPQVLPPGAPTADYLAELDRAQPYYVLVSDRATPEFGLPLFGVDYGRQIQAWLDLHYRVTAQIGQYDAVSYPPAWGALVYQRN